MESEDRSGANDGFGLEELLETEATGFRPVAGLSITSKGRVIAQTGAIYVDIAAANPFRQAKRPPRIPAGRARCEFASVVTPNLYRNPSSIPKVAALRRRTL